MSDHRQWGMPLWKEVKVHAVYSTNHNYLSGLATCRRQLASQSMIVSKTKDCYYETLGISTKHAHSTCRSDAPPRKTRRLPLIYYISSKSSWTELWVLAGSSPANNFVFHKPLTVVWEQILRNQIQKVFIWNFFILSYVCFRYVWSRNYRLMISLCSFKCFSHWFLQQKQCAMLCERNAWNSISCECTYSNVMERELFAQELWRGTV